MLVFVGYIYIIIFASYPDCKCYTLRVLRTAPPVHSVTQSICYIYIIITTSCRCCKCYTRFALRASLAAAVSYNIPYTCTHTVSYRITYYPAHTHADYAYAHAQSDRHIHIQLPNIIARTVMPRHTKSRNVLRSFYFKPGGGSNQIRFPFESCC
jgi:hypothetical protein